MTPRTVARRAPLSMEFFRQEYWSGLSFSSPGELPDPGIEPRSPALQADFLLSETPEKLSIISYYRLFQFLLLEIVYSGLLFFSVGLIFFFFFNNVFGILYISMLCYKLFCNSLYFYPLVTVAGFLFSLWLVYLFTYGGLNISSYS